MKRVFATWSDTRAVVLLVAVVVVSHTVLVLFDKMTIDDMSKHLALYAGGVITAWMRGATRTEPKTACPADEEKESQP